MPEDHQLDSILALMIAHLPEGSKDIMNTEPYDPTPEELWERIKSLGSNPDSSRHNEE